MFEEACPPEEAAAIVVELAQGEDGFIPAPKTWVQAVRALCDRYGILLIADEVQIGFGRSGRMFVSDYWTEWGCPPDIIGMAKSIAGGIPLGAVTAGESIYAKVKPGTIGGTFGDVIRFLCPLAVTDAQIEAGLAILKNAITASIAKLA
ncbi:aminotransferase class III-fold pyridoxal phosphate-dependent enzyme [Treponema endosymbiont of Eucomonympha sp.]|uniref:aminotransferase class III-fold pyridoxal phosphate-dependent enzyme n=1 Tax=Treponema endosymbiont of Eucomonympha sp. TaxID=1580831 RepID=UPI0007843F5C|nr:aminotransferase class III-fold pyridoxal phosphate-dependent enzyme [Treponema endosymbiont of Eucomonympha sp.]